MSLYCKFHSPFEVSTLFANWYSPFLFRAVLSIYASTYKLFVPFNVTSPSILPPACSVTSVLILLISIAIIFLPNDFAEFKNLQLNYENLPYNYALYYYGEICSSGY